VAKNVRIKITAEIEIPKALANDSNYLTADSLVGEWVKIKSGEFENIAVGVVTEAVVVEQKIPRKDANKR
jgi:hypothetical protein